MSEGATIIRGPWRRTNDPERSAASGKPVATLLSPTRPVLERPELTDGKMMLGFVVRDLAVQLGRAPSARELADWANHQSDDRGDFCLFGRAITVAEAELILRQPGRPVTVRPERMRLPRRE